MADAEKVTDALSIEQGYDRHEVNGPLIGGLMFGTVVVIVLSVLGLQYYYDISYEQQIYQKVLEPEADELKNLRAREDEQLHSYRYIDRDKGTVRLPIERAMELLAAEYAAGAVKYPTTPYAVKTEEETAAVGGANAAE